MQGLKSDKAKIQTWREKAKKYRGEKQALKSRLKEVIEGRSKWREKHRQTQLEIKCLRKELACKKTQLRGVSKGHKYDCFIVSLSLWLRQNSSCSLRSCQKILRLLILILELEHQFPSHTSISNWEKKLGYYRVFEKPSSSGDWVIIIDESITVGQQKMLLILGVNLADYKFGQAVKFEDVEVLDFGIQKSWKGEAIDERLKGITSKGVNILYCVCDGGNNLCKSLKISQIIRVEDCTHAIGKLLEKQYKDKEEFVKFSRECVGFKRRKMQSEIAFLIPPTQRSKGRFLNLEPLAKWAREWILFMKKVAKKRKSPVWLTEIEWLKEYEQMVEKIYTDCQVMHQLFKIIKHQGLSEKTAAVCRNILDKSSATDFFKTGVLKYLENNLNKLGEGTSLICTSDIIESFFGKLKNRLSLNKEIGLTDSCLTIANFTKDADCSEIKKAMEEVKIVDIKNWRNENLEVNLIQKKKEVFKNAG